MKVKSESEVAQSCPTLSDPMDHSLPGSSIYWIYQAIVLDWVAIAVSLTNVYDYVKPHVKIYNITITSEFPLGPSHFVIYLFYSERTQLVYQPFY